MIVGVESCGQLRRELVLMGGLRRVEGSQQCVQALGAFCRTAQLSSVVALCLATALAKARARWLGALALNGA